jgi:putative ABC transport system permease protein
MDKRVKHLAAYTITTVQIDYKPDGKLLIGPRPRGLLTGTDAAQCPYDKTLLVGDWISDYNSTGEVAVVINANAFWGEAPAIGSDITLLAPQGSVLARVVGHLQLPRQGRGSPRTGMPTMFVSTANYEAHFKVSGRRLPYDIVTINFKREGEIDYFRQAWSEKLLQGGAPCRIEDPEKLLAQMDERATAALMRTSPIVLGLSGMATICIIITTLLLGLRNRLHTLAMLRAIGAERRHLYLLVLSEAFQVAVSGCVLGIFAGWVSLKLMAQRMPASFPAGVALDRFTIVAAIVCAFSGVVGAAIAPCVQAARLKPLEILQNMYAPKQRLSVIRTVVGFLLLLPAPLLALRLPMDVALRCKLLLYLALPALIVGCILVAPLVVILAERIFSVLLSRLTGINPKLFSQPLSLQLGRVVSTAITISIGLGLYIAIETWGSSLTQPFLPSQGFPDVIVTFAPQGIDADKAEAAQRVEGLRQGESFVLESEQFILDDETLERIRANKEFTLSQNNVLVLGIDPAKAFGGKTPMFKLPFVSGSASAAERELAKGGTCVVPAMFATQSRFKVGDYVGIRVPVRDRENNITGERIEHLKIVGVIDASWHLITARAGLRGLDGNPFYTFSPIFVSYDQARSITSHDDKIQFVWANLSDKLKALQVEDATTELQNQITRAIGFGGADGVSAGMRMLRPGPRGGDRTFVQVSYRDFVLEGTVKHADDIISSMSRVPLWALAILSLSIVNAVMASVQVRRVEIGRMRAIGLSRSQLLRLICIEGVLVGAAACLLSLIFGIESGWCFTGYSRGMMAFGAIPVSFRLPVMHLIYANLFALGLALSAAIVPAWMISRREPADLLRQ